MSGRADPLVVVLSTDLMDRSRFAVLEARARVRVVRSAEALAGALVEAVAGDGPTVACVDLARPDALTAVDAARGAGVRCVAYGSHVDRERLDAAHAAGAEVQARSAFFGRLPGLLDEGASP